MKQTFKLNISDKSTYSGNIPDSFSDNLNFFVQTSGEYFALANYFTKRSGLQSFMLLYTVSGAGNFTYNGKTHLLSADSVMLIDCNDYQYYRTSEEEWHFYYIHFTGINAYRLISGLFGEGYFYLNKLNSITAAENVIKIVRNDTLDSKIKNLENCAHLSIVLSELCRANSKATRQNIKYLKLLKKSDDYFKQNFAASLSLDDLCHDLGFSKFHFIRLFKKYKGASPYDYVIMLRINFAKDLLLNTDKSIEEIAPECGYDSATNLIRAFKKATGMTPAAYRKL